MNEDILEDFKAIVEAVNYFLHDIDGAPEAVEKMQIFYPLLEKAKNISTLKNWAERQQEYFDQQHAAEMAAD